MHIEQWTAAIALAAFVSPCTRAAAQSTQEPPTPVYLAGTCTNCHGSEGRSVEPMPRLAGLPSAYLLEQMLLFREGKRTATIMHQIAKGYTDQQLALLADYFARQRPAD